MITGQYNRHDAGDNAFIVEFYERSFEDPIKTEQEGRPIFKTVPYIRMTPTGQNAKTVWDKKVTEEHKARFSKEWHDFENKTEGKLDGTPLSEWPAISASRIKALEASGVHTLERLTAMPDSAVRSIGPGFIDYKYRAKEFLDGGFKSEQEFDKLRARIAELEDSLKKSSSEPVKKKSKKKDGEEE